MKRSFIEMRKNQTLLVAGILLLASTAVAQAQGVYESLQQRGERPHGRRRGVVWQRGGVPKSEE